MIRRSARGRGVNEGCTRSSLSNYPDHRRSPTGTSGDNIPGSPDFRCRLTHYPSSSGLLRPGGAQCREDVAAAAPFVTRRNNRAGHASLPRPEERHVGPTWEDRPASRGRSHGRHPVDPGPGERLMGDGYEWEFVDVLVARSRDHVCDTICPRLLGPLALPSVSYSRKRALTNFRCRDA